MRFSPYNLSVRRLCATGNWQEAISSLKGVYSLASCGLRGTQTEMENRFAIALDHLGRAIETMSRRLRKGPIPLPRDREGEVLTVIERLRELIADLGATAVGPGQWPCANCAEKENYRQPCDGPDELLPGACASRGQRAYLCGLKPNPNTDNGRDFAVGQYEVFRNCAHIFTPKQWEVIVLYFRDRRTQLEISQRLHLSPNSVSERLTRAKEQIHRCCMRTATREDE